MSDDLEYKNSTQPAKQSSNKSIILRVVPDHVAGTVRYLVKIVPDNTSQLFGSHAEALRYIQIVVQQ